MTEQLTHPTPADLRAFSLGQLAAPAAAAIETHITECPSCCDTLLGISDEDTFVALLKEAEERHDDADDATVAHRLTASSESGEDAADVPESLVNHARYRVVGQIGKGGMGDVYRAEHRLMERTVALKVINRDLFSKPEAVQRFHREVRAAARLSHPNIITAYDAEQAGDVHFLAMEFVDGTVLSEIVNERGPLPVREAVDYVRQAAAGLEHAHEMGMVHRDIKPQNLMLDSSGNVKILDFGLANFASESAADVVSGDTSESAGQGEVLQHLTQLGAMMGTPDYIAPEQARDARSADIRSDIYSLGCTLYYLLTGRPPFAENSVLEKVRAHSEREPDSLCAVRDDIPAELDDVVRRMMAKDPAERYQTPAEVVEALGLLPVRSDDSTAPSLLLQGSEGRSGRRPKWLVAAGLLLPLFAAAGVILYLATDTGKLEIKASEDLPGARIVLTKDAQEYATFELKQGSEVQSIRAGDYRISLQGTPDDVDMSVQTKRSGDNDWGPPDDYERDPVVVYRGSDIRIEVSRSRPSEVAMQRSTGTAVAVLYLVSDDGRFVRVHVTPNGFEETVVRNLGNAFRDVEGLAMSDEGTLYAAVHGADGESSLFVIDVDSGTALEVGPMGFAEVDGLAWHEGKLLAVTSQLGGDSARLLSVDPATGKATAIGDPLPLEDLDSLTVDGRGGLLTTDGKGIEDQFYQLDATGAAPPRAIALTPSIIENSRDIEGLTLGADGKLYGVTHPDPLGNGPFRSHLVRIDPETFAYEDLGLLSYGTFGIVGDLRFQPATVEGGARPMTEVGRSEMEQSWKAVFEAGRSILSDDEIKRILSVTPQQRFQRAMLQLDAADTVEKRFYALNDAAKGSFVAGNIEDARKYAQELMTLLPQFQGNWNYGNAVQDANLVLGRIAVREGRIDDAKKYLLGAGKSPGSPQMNSFGPNMSLAKDLLENGERQIVLDYFELCRKFWEMHDGRLDKWSQQVKDEGIPDFGANLVY